MRVGRGIIELRLYFFSVSTLIYTTDMIKIIYSLGVVKLISKIYRCVYIVDEIPRVVSRAFDGL